MENLINKIIAQVESSEPDPEVSVMLNAAELDAVTTVLLNVINSIVDLEESGQELSPKVNRFYEDLSSAYEKLNA